MFQQKWLHVVCNLFGLGILGFRLVIIVIIFLNVHANVTFCSHKYKPIPDQLYTTLNKKNHALKKTVQCAGRIVLGLTSFFKLNYFLKINLMFT